MVASEQMFRVSDLMQQRGVDVRWLVRETGLEERIVRAIERQQYTPSPQQRAYVAEALHANCDEIMWEHAIEVAALKEPV